MWDKALCFITNSKAKAGGTSEKIISQKYQLLLIDLQGQVVHLKKLKCPAEVVDMLIGYEYAGYHPEQEQKSDYLLSPTKTKRIAHTVTRDIYLWNTIKLHFIWLRVWILIVKAFFKNADLVRRTL